MISYEILGGVFWERFFGVPISTDFLDILSLSLPLWRRESGESFIILFFWEQRYKMDFFEICQLQWHHNQTKWTFIQLISLLQREGRIQTSFKTNFFHFWPFRVWFSYAWGACTLYLHLISQCKSRLQPCQTHQRIKKSFQSECSHFQMMMMMDHKQIKITFMKMLPIR